MNDEIKLAVSHMQAVVIRLHNGSTVIGWPKLLSDPEDDQRFKLYDGEHVYTISVQDVDTVARVIV
ncbi:MULTISPECIES: hypothetical protein [Paenibacillus]|uniref:Uncharacterized protein n=1 Tax=Paenibacillus brasilensis TaxID=128574 RepID=A0ABU0L1F5_9BACL|nr:MULTISPECIES: hypothetical protein [Paenibacillus]MDQ0495517.1 hypothetical protein [Paenibacillus brasilensis]